MPIHDTPSEKQITHAPAQTLAVRSATLLTRGLRDLARNSNWLVQKIFNEQSAAIAISPMGQISTISSGPSNENQHLAAYDLSTGAPISEFSPRLDTPLTHFDEGPKPVLVCSPTGQYLAATSRTWKPILQLFDLQTKALLNCSANFSSVPSSLAWSETGNFFTAAAGVGKNASLHLWKTAAGSGPLSDLPARSLGIPDGIERQTYEAEFGDEGAFRGYGKCVFSPDEKSLAATLEFNGEWADDSIWVANAPALDNPQIFQAQGHITDLTWSHDDGQIVYCASGQAYRLSTRALSSVELPFGAEMCACHPFLPICVCFSSWLKNSAKGRLFLFDLEREKLFDECAAEGILALRWSGDGSTAYAVAENGLAYTYESPLV